jgi:hypothetical protein
MRVTRLALRDSLVIFLGILWVISFSAADSWSQTFKGSDESGTLVMVARSKSAVVLSVDSKVTHLKPLPGFPDIPIDPNDIERKIVDVGQHGACAIDGYLGSREPHKDVAEALREWIRANPKTEVREGISDLLEAAADAGDRQKYSPDELPQGRKRGYRITLLVCGDFFDGHPAIIRGETYVAEDGSAGQRLLTPEMGDIFYVAGPFETGYFIALMTSPETVGQVTHSQTFPSDFKISADFRSSASAATALEAWRAADIQIRAGANSSSSLDALPTWSESVIKDLFVPVFTSVESHLQEVAPPNHVRLITVCGRFVTTLEAERWPSCPSSPENRQLKRHWGSRAKAAITSSPK